MPFIEDVERMIDAAVAQGRRPVRLEMGERQARDLATQLNDRIAKMLPGIKPPVRYDAWMLLVWHEPRDFHGIPVQGVESPDWLALVCEEPSP